MNAVVTNTGTIMKKRKKTHYSGARLKKLRMKMRMSQAQFANEVEVAQRTICNWETEYTKITLAYARLFFELEKQFMLDIKNAEV